MKKRLTAALLAVLMMASMFAMSANAETVFEITKQPGDIEAPVGTTAFTQVAAAADGDVTYRWFYRESWGGDWIDTGRTDEYGNLVRELEGYNESRIYVPVTESTLGQEFYCLVTCVRGDEVETLASDVVTVKSGLTSTVSIETQPEDIVAASGETGTAQVGIRVVSEPIVEVTYIYPEVPAEEPASEEENTEPAEGEPVEGESEPEETYVEPIAQETYIERSTTVTYQWMVWDAAANDWQAASFAGSRSDTVQVPATAENDGQQLVCLVRTADGGAAWTDVITVRMQGAAEPEEPEKEEPAASEPAEITIETQPADIVSAIGTIGTATVKAESDAELSYQWYFRRGTGNWQASGFAGSKTDTISVPVTTARIGQQYKCVITTADGSKVETAAVTVLEPEPSEITIVTQPEDIRGKLGADGTGATSGILKAPDPAVRVAEMAEAIVKAYKER